MAPRRGARSNSPGSGAPRHETCEGMHVLVPRRSWDRYIEDRLMRPTSPFLVLALAGLTGSAAVPSKADGQVPPEDGRTAPTPAETEEQMEARQRFFKGLELFRAESWGAALAEFEASRRLHPTRAATRNAAICLKNLERYEESVSLYEGWITSFPDAPPEERARVEEELKALARLVGTLEVRVREGGASVFVDGVDRGTSPLAAPLRLSAGTHLVQIYKEGYVPSQASVLVAGAASATVDLSLRPLAQSGRLRVAELDGRTADVIIDGIKVGSTPWEGALAPGEHYVVLAAPGDFGSQPVAAPVRLGDVTTLTIPLAHLPGVVTVKATPPGALIALDGVSVGRGSFRGRVRLGRHQIEVGLEGYVASRKSLTIEAPGERTLEIALDRDRTSGVWSAAPQPRFAVGFWGGPVLGPPLSGAVTASCEDGCSATPAYGVIAVGALGYRWPLGITAGVELGYLGVFQRVLARRATLYERPDALRQDAGEVDDAIALQGLLAGPSLAVDGGEELTWRARLLTGMHVANAADRRVGRFAPSGGGTPYTTDPYGENARALGLALAAELHLGTRLSNGLEIGGGIAPILLIGLDEPTWENDRDVLAPGFLGYYEPERTVGDVVFLVAPTLGLSGLF